MPSVSPSGRPGWAQALLHATQAAGDPKRPWSRRMDGAVMASLALLTVVLRLPHRAETLQAWDSVLFALGVEQYDVAAARPHPPGYPVYIFLAKLVHLVVPDVNGALVWVSVLASATAVALLYGFVRQLGSLRAALAASALFMVTPFFVFNGVVALSYACEAAATVGIAWLAWRVRQSPTTTRIAALGVAWGLAVGLRQSLLFFLTPLLLFVVFLPWSRLRTAARRAATLALAAGATFLAWFVPMVWASGGFARWRGATELQSSWIVFSESVFTDGWPAFLDHWTRMLFFLSHEEALLPMGALIAAVALGLVATRGRHAWRTALGWPPGTLAFLGAWLLPALLFYLLVFNGWRLGPVGYILVLLPGLYALFALAADGALRALETHVPWSPAKRTATLLALPFLLIPAPAIGDGTQAYLDQEVVAHDEWTRAWEGVRVDFPPNQTALLSWYSWAYAKWYFPDYLMWSYLPEPGRGGPDWVLTLETRNRIDDRPFYDAHAAGPNQSKHPIPDHIQTIVLFDFQLAGENGAVRRLLHDVPVHEATLSNGWRVLYIEPDPARPAIEDYFRYLPDAYRISQ